MEKLYQLKCYAEEDNLNKVIKDIVKGSKEKGINEGNSLLLF